MLSSVIKAQEFVSACDYHVHREFTAGPLHCIKQELSHYEYYS